MKCPVDGTTLETHTFHATQVDECEKCKGIWFEAGELEQAKDETDSYLRWLDFDLWSDHDGLSVDWSTNNCPQCGKTMAKIAYDETGVTVDTCPDGHGIWLEKGEFQAIIEALENEVTTKNVAEYISASLEEARELVTGDEGFVSEWKDFRTVTRLLQYRVLSENPKLAELLVGLSRSNPL